MKIDTSDHQEWVSRVAEWQRQTHAVPHLAREHIVKSKLKPEEAQRGPMAMFEDPLSIQFAMGYKDRRNSLTYDMLKRIPQQLSIIAAILQTRCNQVASFSTPFRLNKSLGFAIKHKNPSRLTTKGEREFIQTLETFIYNCGANDPNPHNPRKRDDFETFLKKIVRDSLMYDSCTFEIVPDKRGLPYEFMAVDASTVRIAADDFDLDQSPMSSMTRGSAGAGTNYLQRASELWTPNGPYRTLKVRNPELEKVPAYVQLWNGQIKCAYTADELAYGVRNPRTDIYAQGYGYSELEQLITIITAHLNAEAYNSTFFTNGANPKGMLSFKGDSMSPEMLEAFKRQWRENMEGVAKSWRTPIMQSEQGVDWIDLHKSNQDMEFGQWMEYLLKITCAVYLVDPAELNFDMHGGVQQTPLFESSQEWKLKASRDRGLKPLLRFIAKLINDHVVAKLDDHFSFDFVGLDELTEMEKHELRKEQIASYRTLNEIRREDDLPDIEDGDIPLNPTYTTYVQQKRQAELQAQQQQAMATPPTAGGTPGEEEASDEEAGSPGGDSQYADSFTKSMGRDVKILQISLDDDDWVDIYRGS